MLSNAFQINISGHGYYLVTPAALRRVLGRHWGATVEQLQAEVAERTGADYSEVVTPFELVAVLADIEQGDIDLERAAGIDVQRAADAAGKAALDAAIAAAAELELVEDDDDDQPPPTLCYCGHAAELHGVHGSADDSKCYAIGAHTQLVCTCREFRGAHPETLTAGKILPALHSAGYADAYVQQTGGGCATIYLGPGSDALEVEGLVAIGPGGYNWHDPDASTFGNCEEIYVGPSYESGDDADTCTTVAEIVAAVQRHYGPAQAVRRLWEQPAPYMPPVDQDSPYAGAQRLLTQGLDRTAATAAWSAVRDNLAEGAGYPAPEPSDEFAPYWRAAHEGLALLLVGPQHHSAICQLNAAELAAQGEQVAQ